MTPFKALRLSLLAAVLTACGPTQFFAPPAIESELRVNVRAATVVINDVSMPEYAINQEIPIEQPDGSLIADTDRLWADLPDRALKGALARHLNVITDASVAVEPWPLSGFPDVEVSVFVEDMIVESTGTLRFAGTYALRSDAGGGTIRNFAIDAPVADLRNYVAIILAHEIAWQRLAELIAQQI